TDCLTWERWSSKTYKYPPFSKGASAKRLSWFRAWFPSANGPGFLRTLERCQAKNPFLLDFEHKKTPGSTIAVRATGRRRLVLGFCATRLRATVRRVIASRSQSVNIYLIYLLFLYTFV